MKTNLAVATKQRTQDGYECPVCGHTVKQIYDHLRRVHNTTMREVKDGRRPTSTVSVPPPEYAAAPVPARPAMERRDEEVQYRATTSAQVRERALTIHTLAARPALISAAASASLPTIHTPAARPAPISAAASASASLPAPPAIQEMAPALVAVSSASVPPPLPSLTAAPKSLPVSAPTVPLATNNLYDSVVEELQRFKDYQLRIADKSWEVALELKLAVRRCFLRTVVFQGLCMADIMRNWDAVNAEDGWMKRDKRYAVKGTVRLQPGTIKSMLGYLKQFLQSLQHYMRYEHVYIATALCITDTWMRNSN